MALAQSGHHHGVDEIGLTDDHLFDLMADFGETFGEDLGVSASVVAGVVTVRAPRSNRVPGSEDCAGIPLELRASSAVCRYSANLSA